MLRLPLLVLPIYLCLKIVVTKDCVLNHESKEVTWERRLTEDLQCNYDVNKAPENNTDVHVKFIVKYFSFDSNEQIFTVSSWMYMGWIDKRLTWNESDYQGISELVFFNHLFWTPTLRLLNEIDAEISPYYFGQCTATDIGYIYCIPRVAHIAVCTPKLANWPYDTQNCTLKFGAWSPGDNFTFTFSHFGAVTLIGAEYGSEWTIIDYDKSEQEDKITQLRLTFVLKRESGGLTGIVIIPTIVVTILILLTFLLDVKNNVRLGMVSFSLLCQFALIGQLNEKIPKYSEDKPTVIYYLISSEYINILLIILTIYLADLCKKNTSPPCWIVNINDRVSKMNYCKYVIWPRWDVAHQDNREESHRLAQQHWNDFANILNSICFMLVIVIYIFYICLYMPRPS